jgi:hypothetical protein
MLTAVNTTAQASVSAKNTCEKPQNTIVNRRITLSPSSPRPDHTLSANNVWGNTVSNVSMSYM